MTANIQSVKIIIAVTIIFLFIGCSKAPSLAPTKPVSAVNFLNASPNSQSVNVLIANAKFNANPTNYGQSTGYIGVYSGLDSIVVNNSITQASIIKTTVNFTAYNNFSVFLINTPAHQDLLLLQDTLNKPNVNLANSALRFVNVSPDAPAVDLVIKSSGSLVTNKSFKGYSSFAEVQGNQSYTLQVIKTGTQTVLATSNSIKFQAGTVYLVWLHGLVANTSSADQLTLDISSLATPQ